MSDADKFRSTYKAHCYHKSFSKGEGEGILEIRKDALVFSAEINSVTFELSRVNIRVGGAGDRYVVFTHPDYPEWSIFLSDKSILSNHHLITNKAAADQIRAIKTRTNRLLLYSAFGIVLFAVLIYGLVLAKNPLIDYVTSRIPVEWEVEFGSAIFNQFSSSKHRLK